MFALLTPESIFFAVVTLIGCGALVGLADEKASKAEQKPFVNVPDTVSAEAKKYLSGLTDPALLAPWPEPSDTAGWNKLSSITRTCASRSPRRRSRRSSRS